MIALFVLARIIVYGSRGVDSDTHRHKSLGG